eukprot:4721057-Prymnesium_polylepis.1
MMGRISTAPAAARRGSRPSWATRSPSRRRTRAARRQARRAAPARAPPSVWRSAVRAGEGHACARARMHPSALGSERARGPGPVGLGVCKPRR